MDELIDRLAAKVGLQKAVAGRAVSGFLRSEAPCHMVPTLTHRLSGAEAAIAAPCNRGLMTRVTAGSLVMLGATLIAAVLGMLEIKRFARERFKLGRDKTCADHMGVIVAGTS